MQENLKFNLNVLGKKKMKSVKKISKDYNIELDQI